MQRTNINRKTDKIVRKTKERVEECEGLEEAKMQFTDDEILLIEKSRSRRSRFRELGSRFGSKLNVCERTQKMKTK